MRLGQDDEIFPFAPAPAGWDGDAVFLVDRMTKLASEKFLRLRFGVHAGELFHSNPLPPTFNHFAQAGVNKK